jgi:pyruvate,water dikinase
MTQTTCSQAIAVESVANFIRWFNTIGMGDISQVGNKKAALEEVIPQSTNRGIKVLLGFAATAAQPETSLGSHLIAQQ